MLEKFYDCKDAGMPWTYDNMKRDPNTNRSNFVLYAVAGPIFCLQEVLGVGSDMVQEMVKSSY